MLVLIAENLKKKEDAGILRREEKKLMFLFHLQVRTVLSESLLNAATMC